MERLPGFRDFYPEPVPTADVASADARQYIFDKWRAMARGYGFREYDGPPLESLELFTAKSGQEIVGQLYNFVDKGDRAVALRPEMTPTLARMISTYERNYKKPVKWFAIPQLFRYEKHQRGRLREHFQFNADIIGETDAAADAELIALLIDTLRSFGLTVEDFVIRLSSRQAWHEFFVANHGDPAKEYEFFQVIDKLERTEPAENGEKLHAIGFTLEVVNAFIEKAEPTADLRPIVENLAARGMSSFVRIDYRVIRGLAYYTGPVFEAFDKKGDCPRAIAGGGRYDNLIQLISSGKVNLPSLGFGMGDVVLRDLLEARNLLPAFDAGIDVYCIVAHEELRPVTLRLVQDLRLAGLAVDYSLTPAKPDKQFKRAQELKAGYVAQVLRAETGEVLAKVKNLQTRQEVQVAPGEVIESIKKA